MKKLILKICTLCAVVFLVSSCDKDDHISIPVNELPTAAQSFLNENFNAVQIVSVFKDRDVISGNEYEVLLNTGVAVKFNKQGEWEEVEAKNDKAGIPTSFISKKILDYVNTTHSPALINSIDKEKMGYEVELTNGLELNFDREGNYLGQGGGQVASASLPDNARLFLNTHFSEVKIVSTEVERDGLKGLEYEVVLANGIEVTFDNAGNWKEVDAKNDRNNIPSSFILPKIMTYITTNHANVLVNSVEIKNAGFEVALTNGVELLFDTNGNYLGKEGQTVTTDLPADATTFLNNYFAGLKVISVDVESEGLNGLEYEVVLENGIEVKFDKDGVWKEVDSKNDKVGIPTDFILPAILTHIKINYSTVLVNSIDKEINSYEVELTNGVELIFDTAGKFLRIDR